MSLKAFHIFFILVSLALCAFSLLWGHQHNDTSMVAFGSGGLFILAIYFAWFIKKSRTLPLLAFLTIFSPKASEACAVCFGAADPQTTSAIQNSILFLIGVTALVLFGLTYVVVQAIRQTKNL